MRAFLVAFLLSWIAGIIIGQLAPHSWAISLTIVAIVLLTHRARFKAPYRITAALLFMLATVYATSNTPTTPTCNLEPPLTGTVIGYPTIEADRIQYEVETKTGCRILLYASRFPLYQQGDTLDISGGTLGHRDELPPELAGYQQYLIRRTIIATWRFPSIERTSQAPTLTGTLRATAHATVHRVIGEPDASFITALVLADRGTLPEDLVSNFRATGTSHILAISGLHLSLIAGLLVGLATLLPLPPWPRTMLVLLLLWSYVILIGAPVSTQRAATFWTIALIGLHLRRVISLTTIILLTATILLSLNPRLISDVGFQLSVSAVTGIMLTVFLARPLLERLHGSRQWLAGLLLASLGATLATTPLIVYHFGTLSFVTVLANLLVIPPLPVILTLAILTIFAALIMPPLALLIAYPLHLLFIYLDRVTETLAALPLSHLENVTLPTAGVVAIYAALITLIILTARRFKRPWRELWV